VDIFHLLVGYFVFPPRIFWGIPDYKRCGHGTGRACQQERSNRKMTYTLLIIHMRYRIYRFFSLMPFYRQNVAAASSLGKIMTNTKLSLAEDRQKLGWLLGAVALVATPHVLNLAPVVMAYFSLLAMWYFAALYFKVPLPKRALLFLLTLAGAGIVLGHYHRFWGQEAGSSLFMVGLGLKLLEINTQRDAYLVVFLAFFVALTQYIFSQSIPMASYTLLAVVLLVAAMIGLNSNPSFPVKARLKMAVLMVAQALPVMALLFVFFPRIEGPLWELPDDSHAAKTGLGDSISPGSISRLALSQETAFRVDFEGELPAPKLRYWRGPVFWHTNGEKWTLLPTTPLAPGHKPQFADSFHRYLVTLEPHNQRWVFALDLPDIIPAELEQTSDLQLLAKADVTERKQYRLSSGTAYTTGPLNQGDIKKGLQLPANPGTRLEQLVKVWQEENPTPKRLVEKALRYFRDEPFYYTLNPPLLNGNTVESFMFETRRGFCEHFATAFVILMRIGGVPARVVTGYQGGQWNSIGRFLEVKQADAHAWAEVWLPVSGWTRVDPTAAVAPERIEHGVDVETQVALGEIRFNIGDGLATDFGLGAAWRRVRMVASTIDHAWDSWVLAYGTENQARLFQWLRLSDWRLLGACMSIGLVLTLLAAGWSILQKRPTHTDPAKRIYQKFAEKIAAHGFTLQRGEGPCSFAERIGKSSPILGKSAASITELYVRIRYEQFHEPNDLAKLRGLVKQLPKPNCELWHRLWNGH
jgi:transglutaminase-like putative cysteine protease